MMDFVSWDDDIPNWMESHKIPWFQTTNQIYLDFFQVVKLDIPFSGHIHMGISGDIAGLPSGTGRSSHESCQHRRCTMDDAVDQNGHDSGSETNWRYLPYIRPIFKD